MLYLRLEKNINNIENTGNLALIEVWQKVAFSLRSFSAEMSDRVSSLKTCLHRTTVSLAAMSLDEIFNTPGKSLQTAVETGSDSFVSIQSSITDVQCKVDSYVTSAFACFFDLCHQKKSVSAIP